MVKGRLGSSPDITCWVMLGQSPNSLPCFPLHDTEVTAVPKRASWQRWVRAINRSKWRCPALGGVPSEPGSPPQEEHDGVDGHNGDGEEDSGDNDDSVIAWIGHQDVRRNFCPEGQEAVKAWEVGRAEARRAG